MNKDIRAKISRHLDSLNEDLDSLELFYELAKLMREGIETNPQKNNIWAQTKKKHQMMMFQKFVEFTRQSCESTFEDDNSLNPLRSMWEMCFETLAEKEIRATNFVENNWNSSGRDRKNLDIQKRAVNRGVTIDRVFIVDTKSLSGGVFWDFRNVVTQQLGAGIQVHLLRRANADVDGSGKLRSLDFIVFDNETVYSTNIDKSLDEREKKNTIVDVTQDQEILKSANMTWEGMLQRADSLTLNNMDDLLVPGNHVF